MYFKKLPSNSKEILDEILAAEIPSEMLRKRFKGLSEKEDEELRGIIRELMELGYIDVMWAGNAPYQVTINNSARTYDEQLKKYEMKGKPDPISLSDNAKIFISHRSSDAEFADALLEFLIATGIPREMFFCSSLPGNDVNERISVEVKETIKRSCLNIAILSNEYYQSAYCLNEAGILWFQDVPVIPIALPEIHPENMIGFLNADYKIRRLDNIDDLAYIYDTVQEASKSSSTKAGVVTAEARKLLRKYEKLITERDTPHETKSSCCLNITTDDERIVLYYLISNKIRKATKVTIQRWLQDMEIYGANVDNAFDLMSNLGNGSVVNETLKLDIELFRKLSSESSQVLEELGKTVYSHIELSSDKFNRMWDEQCFDDHIKLFVAYIIDKKIDSFGERWMRDGQIDDIKKWEKEYFLEPELSSNYDKCISLFKHNRFLYESEWTSHGNARAYSLCASLKELLFNNCSRFTEELQHIKDTHRMEFPF